MQSLTQKTIRGVKWNSLAQAMQQITQLLTTIVLARLLTPRDFGLVGMAVVITGMLAVFRDLGTAAAVIREKDVTHSLLCSVFWLNAAFGLFSFLFLSAFAPLAAIYYHEFRVVPVIRVLAIGFLISSCGILQQTLLEKRLMFQLLAKIEIGSTLFGCVVGIVLAVFRAGVWALIAQSLATTGLSTILLWCLSAWRPSREISFREIRRILNYSANLTGFNVFNYFARNADYLLIGRFLGSNALGLYTLAYKIMLYPLQSVTNVIGRVVFPAFSEAQDDDERLRRGYLRAVAMISMATFPMMIGLWVAAPPFVLSLFGPNWLPIIPLIRIFAPIGMAQSVAATVGAIYQAKGRTDILLKWGVLSGTIYVVGFATGLRWGIKGIAVSYLVLNFVLAIPSFVIPFRLIQLKLLTFLGVLRRPLLGSVLMGIVVASIRIVLPPMAPIISLQLMVLLGVVSYAIASWTINRDELRQVLRLVERKA